MSCKRCECQECLLERCEVLRKRANRAEELLRQWLATPFFEDEDGWREWRDEFAGLVHEALRLAGEEQ